MSEQEINPNVFLHSNGLSTERNVVVSVMRMLGADDFDFRLRDRLIVGSAGWIDKERREHAKQLAAALAERDSLAKRSADYLKACFNEHRAILLSCNVALAIAERQDAERKLKAAIGPLTPDTEATDEKEV